MKQVAKVTHRNDGGFNVESFTTIDGVTYRVGGFGLSPNHVSLASRLVRAIEAGKVYEDLSLITRTENTAFVKAGSKYVSFRKLNVIGRTMNADLKRLGF